MRVPSPPPETEQQSKVLLCSRQCTSCIHAGGLSCYECCVWFKFYQYWMKSSSSNLFFGKESLLIKRATTHTLLISGWSPWGLELTGNGAHGLDQWSSLSLESTSPPPTPPWQIYRHDWKNYALSFSTAHAGGKYSLIFDLDWICVIHLLPCYHICVRDVWFGRLSFPQKDMDTNLTLHF